MPVDPIADRGAEAHPDARPLVDGLLGEAMRVGASDIHVDPESGDVAIRLRVDGLMRLHRRIEAGTGRAMVTRLMVMASLLTYRRDIPQEGRMKVEREVGGRVEQVELRVAVMPTTHGLRAVVRLPAELEAGRALEELGLPTGVMAGLYRFAAADSGLLLVTGPAGSGKTTTIYSLLEHILKHSAGVSIVTLEDPVERDLPGVTQIEITPHGQLTYAAALRSVLRQDPQVLMLGEIRDAATASLAIGAALSGHRLVATLHAGCGATAIARLIEMGIEPYQITSALHAVVSQRLLRRVAVRGRGDIGGDGGDGGGDGGERYRGRVVVAELAVMTGELRRAVTQREDAAVLEAVIRREAGHVPLRQVAGELVERGVTDAAEVERVLGPGVKPA
jgi:type II secretory ATPase GspE/PulE/Tfp pilus assembly ATPase PilB-like protein